jgi:hypothetical protein
MLYIGKLALLGLVAHLRKLVAGNAALRNRDVAYMQFVFSKYRFIFYCASTNPAREGASIQRCIRAIERAAQISKINDCSIDRVVGRERALYSSLGTIFFLIDLSIM